MRRGVRLCPCKTSINTLGISTVVFEKAVTCSGLQVPYAKVVNFNSQPINPQTPTATERVVFGLCWI